MISDINEDNIRLLAETGCPRNLWGINHDFYCILQDDEAYYGLYNGSVIDTCRACWLKWLSKESEDNYE